MVPLIQFDCQQRNPLIDVIVQLSRDPGTFLFVGLDQLAPHARHRFLREFAIRHVETRTYVASKGAVGIESWYAYIEHPAIFSIMSPQAIFHYETLPPIEHLGVGIQACLKIFGVHSLCPAVSKLCLKRPPSELQPGLIEISA